MSQQHKKMKVKWKRNSVTIPTTKKLFFPKIGIIKEEVDKESKDNQEDKTDKEENDDKKTNSKDNNSKMNFSEISEKKTENDNEDNYMEKQLSLLFDVFLTSYSKKTYTELIKDIEEKEILLYSNSIMSFKIMILKVKCLTKLLMVEYNNILTFKVLHFHGIDEIIQKIQNEFKKISSMVINNNLYEYEILTQSYCKFLYLLSKISLKKEDYIKSLGYISLGINMIKIFIIRKKLCTEIQTYKIYSKLLLSMINILIGDNNYNQALLYCRTLLKVVEISQKVIYYNSKQDDNKISSDSILISKKFITYAGYAFLYIGCCLEQNEKDIEAFEAYKQAKYFLDKGSITGNPFKTVNITSINNSAHRCAKDSFEKLNLKFQKEKIERLQRQEKMDRLKREQKYQLLQNEKQYKLKLIATGYIGDPNKYKGMEEKLDKLLFSSSIQNDLDKIDDELISFVFTYFKRNNKNLKKSNKNRLSSDTKKLISRYELYNILMSKDFRDFVMKTRKLQFNNPKKGSESISTIQRYLNNKMEIKFIQRNNARSNTRKKTLKFLERQNNSIKLNLNTNANSNMNTSSYTKLLSKENDQIKTLTLPTTSPNSNSNRDIKKKETLIPPINSNKKENKAKVIKFNLMTLSTNRESSDNSRNKMSFKFTPSTRSSKALSLSRKKIYSKNNLNELECDFERKNFDKNLMTKNYLKKYSYYQSLSNKELKLQKAILDFRNHNTLYNPKRALDEKDSKVITKEEIINKFLIINEGVKEKENVVVKDEELEMLKDSFSSDNKISVKMKSAMSKVISKYILEKKKKAKKNVKILNDEEIKQFNEKNLLELNFSIKNINNQISKIRQIAGNNSNEQI